MGCSEPTVNQPTTTSILPATKDDNYGTATKVQNCIGIPCFQITNVCELQWGFWLLKFRQQFLHLIVLSQACLCPEMCFLQKKSYVYFVRQATNEDKTSLKAF